MARVLTLTLLGVLALALWLTRQDVSPGVPEDRASDVVRLPAANTPPPTGVGATRPAPAIGAGTKAATALEVPGDRRGSLTGRVTDAAGEPLAGVHIAIMRKRRSDPPELATVTDGDGGFHLAPLDPGHHWIRIVSPGWVPMSVHYSVPEDGRAGPVLLTLEPAATVHGRVRSAEGLPVPGKLVELVFVEGPQADTHRDALWTGRTDGEGRYAIDDLPPGVYELSLEATDPWELTLSPGEVRTLDLVQRVPPRVVGRVTSDGSPVEGVRVRMHYVASRQVETDANGRFELVLRGRTADHLEFTPRHGRMLVSHRLELGWGDEVVHDVELGSARLEGRLLDATGHPVSDVRLALWSGPRIGDDFVTWATADADGRFGFRHLTPGTYAVSLAYEHRRDWLVEGPGLAECSAATTTVLDLVASPGARVTGMARLPSGRPVPRRSSVRFWRVGDDHPERVVGTAMGRYGSGALPAGDYRLCVLAAGSAEDPQPDAGVFVSLGGHEVLEVDLVAGDDG